MKKLPISLLQVVQDSSFGFLSSFVILSSTTYAKQAHGLNARAKANGDFP